MLRFTISPADQVPKEDIHDAKSRAQEATVENEKLRDQVHQLSLTVEAMWELFKNKLEVDDAELKKMVKEVEFQHAKSTCFPQKCKKCSRPVSATSKMCVFCGTKVERDSVF